MQKTLRLIAMLNYGKVTVEFGNLCIQYSKNEDHGLDCVEYRGSRFISEDSAKIISAVDPAELVFPEGFVFDSYLGKAVGVIRQNGLNKKVSIPILVQ